MKVKAGCTCSSTNSNSSMSISTDTTSESEYEDDEGMEGDNEMDDEEEMNVSFELEIKIKVTDADLVDSKRLSAKITIKGVSVDTSKNMFFANFVSRIDTNHIAVATDSDEYVESGEMGKSNTTKTIGMVGSPLDLLTLIVLLHSRIVASSILLHFCGKIVCIFDDSHKLDLSAISFRYTSLQENM